jgi:hypothetical protein
MEDRFPVTIMVKGLALSASSQNSTLHIDMQSHESLHINHACRNIYIYGYNVKGFKRQIITLRRAEKVRILKNWTYFFDF